MKTTTAFFFFTLIGTTSFAQNLGGTFHVTPYFTLQGFKWEEFDNKGRSALKETGPLYAFGVVSRFSLPTARSVFAELDLQYAMGVVDYDGFIVTTQGVRSPYRTSTGYAHFEGTLSIGYTFRLFGAVELAPVAGFGIEFWNRDLDNGGPNGYDEQYSVSVGDVGVNVAYIHSKNFQVFSGVQLGFPLSLSEVVDLSTRGRSQLPILNLNPGINPRVLLHAGASISRVLIDVYVETWNLSESDISNGYYQPYSTRTRYGVKVGFAFGR